jgi:Ca2+-binding EF-hand superfamily protein
MVSGINDASYGVQDTTALLQKLFKKLDKNGDSKVTKDELKTALSDANSGSTISDTTLNDLFNKLDTDGSGSISESELEAGAQQMRPPPPPPGGPGGPGGAGGPSASDMAQSLFQTADTDGDGKITKDQLYSALSQNGPTPDNMDQIWSETDTNGDGYVTLTELQVAMEKHRQETQGTSSQFAGREVSSAAIYDQTGNAVDQAFRSLFSLLA